VQLDVAFNVLHLQIEQSQSSLLPSMYLSPSLNRDVILADNPSILWASLLSNVRQVVSNNWLRDLVTPPKGPLAQT
jgi:hypothetical protein